MFAIHFYYNTKTNPNNQMGYNVTVGQTGRLAIGGESASI